MANYNQSTRQRVADINSGLRVTASGVGILAAGVDMFNVVGGRVAVLGMIGIVTTQIQAAATTLRPRAVCTAGTTNLSAVSADVTGAAVGAALALPAAAADALQYSATGAVLLHATDWVLQEGEINLLGSADRTGAIEWTVLYVPIDEGAYIEAA
jgi:hypothetical protein